MKEDSSGKMGQSTLEMSRTARSPEKALMFGIFSLYLIIIGLMAISTSADLKTQNHMESVSTSILKKEPRGTANGKMAREYLG